ncbi:MAG: hypothetical protein HQ567_33410, partial [Candidatus Nealsonbacteria bacterium]|nr:hypothetical protein [Candidatus Nealsonbacteria bacterium]
MTTRQPFSAVVILTAVTAAASWCPGAGGPAFGQPARSYRLDSVDLRQRVIWGAECRQPEGRQSEGSGLAFGGQDQDAEDGRPHTRVLVEGRWKAIHRELRAANPLQSLHDRIWQLRNLAKNVRARVRYIYFEGKPPDDEAAFLRDEIAPRQAELVEQLESLIEDLGSAAGSEGRCAAG